MIHGGTGEQPLLLGKQTFGRAAPPACLDFQTRVGRPVISGATKGEPCVLVLTRSADCEVDELSLLLAAEGVPLVRVDSDRCRGTAIGWDEQEGLLSVGSDRFVPVVTWLRYFSTSAMPAAGDDRLDCYVRTQWGSWALAAVDLGKARAINGGAGPCLPNRLTQLSAARAVGLRVPRTVVASQLATAAMMIPGSGDLIVKSLGGHVLEVAPARLHGLFPQRIGRCEIEGIRAAEPAPVMVQEFVEAHRELRIFVVDGDVVAFDIEKAAPDACWSDPDGVRIRPADIPASLASAIRCLAQRWELDVAGFDILDAPSGHVFLEVNAMCDWLVFERATGCSLVSGLVTKLVCGLFASRPSQRGSGMSSCE